MKRCLALLVIVAGASATGRSAPVDVASPLAALSDFFKPGVVWQDKNDDGAVDFVDARIVLPDNPSSAELAAAADVAARLGYETSAMNIPIARLTASAGTSIFIGAKSLPKGVAIVDVTAGLKAGDGVVSAL